MTQKKKIWDYFNDTIEFPKNVADDPIPYGEAWVYISATFLNGFVNYMKPFGCYVINRYKKEDADISDNNVSFGNWTKFKGTKKELIDLIISGKKEVYHTDLRCFSDDIIIVGEIEDGISDDNGKYIFFWFDMDVSDCSIGRFKTSDTKEEILKSVENWLHEDYVENKNHEELHDDNTSGYHKLPLSFIKGWVSF